MTRMTGPDCVVMCNLINTHTHTHTGKKLKHTSMPVSKEIHEAAASPRETRAPRY